MRSAAAAVLGVVLLGAGALAAPILRDAPKVSDEILCLADLKEVTFEVRPMPRSLRDHLIVTERVRKVFGEELRALGLEVRPDRDADTPHMVLSVRASTDTDQPGAMAIYTLIATQQNVELKRLERSMRLPTNITVDVHLTTVKEAPRDVPARVRHTVQQLGKILARGTEAFHAGR